MVTIRPQPGASATLALDFDGARNIRIQGATITRALLAGGTRDIRIVHNRFTGILIVDQDNRRPNIILARNTHNNIPGAVDTTPRGCTWTPPVWW